MTGRALELFDVTFRHRISRPKFANPWQTKPGPGVLGLNFTIEAGQIVGLVGPNGAGKTTLLRILAGVMPIDSGKINLQGVELDTANGPIDRQLRANIGHMPEQVRWSGSATVGQTIQQFSNMQANPVTPEKLLKLVGLSAKYTSPLDELSQGMRQRLSLAVALMGSPKILLLDEPFNGLDPVAAKSVERMIKQLSKQGVAVIISSHQVSGLVDLIDKLLLIHRGQLVADGTLKDIEEKLGLEDRIELSGRGKFPELTELIGSGIILEQSIDDENWRCTIQHADESSIKNIVHAGHSITEWKRKSPDIVELLCQATGLKIDEIGMEIQASNMIPLKTLGEEE